MKRKLFKLQRRRARTLKRSALRAFLSAPIHATMIRRALGA
jgi:hypothetical protein